MPHTTGLVVRALGPSDRLAVLGLCAADPAASVMVAEQVEADPYGLGGGRICGVFEDGELVGGCWFGVNIIPLGALGERALDEVAQRVGLPGRYSSIFGPATLVMGLWDRLRYRSWRARDIRSDQPLLVTTKKPALCPDPLVRQGRVRELDDVMAASSAMFTEEVGYSPIGTDGGATYRRRVAALLVSGRTFLRRTDSGEVIFKADVGSLSSTVAQIHGVWVGPQWRGQGLSAPAMAAVVTATLRDHAPTVSLYVNRYNTRAIAAYRRVGFTQVGTFATILL
ncbi:MAG: GNAT family N-acetyltransferase [Actinomycetota bacterium]